MYKGKVKCPECGEETFEKLYTQVKQQIAYGIGLTSEALELEVLEQF